MEPIELAKLLDEAAERGAKRALASVGLHDDDAGTDIRDLRGLIEGWRHVKKTAVGVVAKWVTVAILGVLTAGFIFTNRGASDPMERNFDRALAEVLKDEGGFVNNPNDNGGATNMGVTIATFRRYVKPNGTVADLKNITVGQVGVVFRRHYWDEVLGNDLPDGIDYAVFDTAINSGPSRAARLLQQVLGVTVDGQIGPQTVAAAKARASADPAELVNAYLDARMEFLKRLSDWTHFGKGWTSRVTRVRRLAKEMAAQPPLEVKHEVSIVKVEQPVPVPVAPPGVEKVGINRLGGLVSTMAAPLAGFGNLDNTTKVIICVAAVVIGVVVYYRGEAIAQRARSIVRTLTGENDAGTNNVAGANLSLVMNALGLGGLALLALLAKRAGKQEERHAQTSADLKSAEIVAEKRASARSATDVELDKRIDRWTRP